MQVYCSPIWSILFQIVYKNKVNTNYVGTYF